MQPADPPDAVIITHNKTELDASDRRRQESRGRVSPRRRRHQARSFGDDILAAS
jgi:hypothetical protein